MVYHSLCSLCCSLFSQILHVSGLLEGVSREELRELFSQAGEVTKVDIPDGGRSMVRRVWVGGHFRGAGECHVQIYGACTQAIDTQTKSHHNKVV